MICHRFRPFLAISAPCVLAAALAVVLLGRSPRSFHGAYPLPSTHGVITNALLESGYDFRRRFTISWFLRSNHTVASFQRTPEGTVQIRRFVPTQPDSPQVEQPAAFEDIDGQPLVFWSVSPDGQWLLTVRRQGPSRLYQVYRADHLLHAQWTHQYEGRSQPDWLNNSQGFVEWPIRESRLLARVYWLDTAQSAEIDLESLPTLTIDHPASLTQPCVAMLYSPGSSGIAAEFLLLSPDREPRHSRRGLLARPETLHQRERTTVTLSPHADQLAWLCETTDRLPRLTISRVPPFVHLEPRLRASLYVSRPDGSQLTFLGRTRPGTTLAAVRWAPEGDQLTFVYQNALWCQPINP